MEQININVFGWTTNPRMLHVRRNYAFDRKYFLPILTGYLFPFQLVRQSSPFGISLFEVTNVETGVTTDVLSDVQSSGLSITPNDDGSETITYLGTVPLSGSWAEGLYFAKMSDNVNVWTSEFFCMSNDLSDAVRLEWRHHEPIEFRDGTIRFPFAFKNYVYLPTDIGKPRYPLDREVQTRNGRIFPLRQTSWKEYAFEVLVSEYLADCLRLVGIHSDVKIHHRGNVYDCDLFALESLDWQEQGDIASAVFTFRTGTFMTTRAKGTATPTEVNPNQCLTTIVTATKFFTLGEIRGVTDPSFYGEDGDFVMIDRRIYSGNDVVGALVVEQVNQVGLIGVSYQAGDVAYNIETGLFYVETGLSEGFTLPRIDDVVPATGTDITISGFGLTGATAELYYQREGSAMFERWPSTFTSAQISSGVTVDGDGWSAVKFVFLTPSCGVIQETETFFIGLPTPDVDTQRGLDFDLLDINLDLL